MMTPNIGGPLIDFHRSRQGAHPCGRADTRLKVAPDIPTAIEAGLPGMVASNFNGLFAPAGMPKEIVDRLVDGTRKVMADAEFQKILHNLRLRARRRIPDRSRRNAWSATSSPAGRRS